MCECVCVCVHAHVAHWKTHRCTEAYGDKKFLKNVYLTHLAEAIKGTIEEHQNSTACHLRDVVQRLAGIVANPGIGIIETRQNRLNKFWQVHPYTRLQVYKEDIYMYSDEQRHSLL